MAAKEIPVKHYVVKLCEEERERLREVIGKGSAPAQRLLKARILLKADASGAGEGWSDGEIIEALDTSVSMVYRVRISTPISVVTETTEGSNSGACSQERREAEE